MRWHLGPYCVTIELKGLEIFANIRLKLRKKVQSGDIGLEKLKIGNYHCLVKMEI